MVAKFKAILNIVKWFFLNKTIYKFNLIRIKTLPPSSQDPRVKFLHGTFQLLSDFVEVKYRNMAVVKFGTSGSSHGLNYLIQEIENYKREGINGVENLEKIRDLYIWWVKYSSQSVSDINLENEKLIELVKVRNYLW